MRKVLELTLDYPADMPAEECARLTAELVRRMDAYHRALGGSGLTVADEPPAAPPDAPGG